MVIYNDGLHPLLQRVIDMLKMDPEGAEWSAMRHIIDTGVYKQIKQVAMEIHTPRKKTSNETYTAPKEEMTVLDFGEVYQTLQDFHRVGFRQYYHNLERSHLGCRRFFANFTAQWLYNHELPICQYEVMYVNSNFL